ncbi:hypothetical protein [Ferruginibacter sp. SUN106]|uniref:hypothetical protein n=1 Tax=Ferruginibacter sp. SUN106 TaxID=2978348 RepID=UPI003D366076
MKTAIILLCLFFLCYISSAQTDSVHKVNADTAKVKKDKKAGRNMVVTLAYHTGTTRSYELSLSKGHTVETGGYPGYFSQYGFGAELFYKAKTYFAAPKISYELDPYLPPMCLSRMNLLYVTDFKNKGSLKYRHEIGFSFGGRFNINYGYTINITNKDFCNTSHSLNLQCNFFIGGRKVEFIRE